jgi:D-alanine-D-alanine ligase
MSYASVAVLRGGPSDEYAVSMKSGQSVLDSLGKSKYRPLDVVITKSGEWLVEGYERYPEQVLSSTDVVFNALHGTYGEDGVVQQLIERYGVPYTGSGVFASRIAMNKVLTKDYLREHSIKMAPHMVVTRDSHKNLHGIVSTISDMFGPEYVIKPITSGSSVGVMMVKNAALLQRAVSDALSVYDSVMVEKRIRGKEATCGVIEKFRGTDMYTLPIVEITLPSEDSFFDYGAKYERETEKICPSCFTANVKRDIEEVARQAHQTLGLSQYSRSDFMISGNDVYFLEVNTLPGLTRSSLMPTAMEAVGISFDTFIDHLLQLSLNATARGGG